MMNQTSLSAIFAKPIDRPIEGVIKADDDASLRLEVEEYVLTNEVAKRLEEFMEAYHNYRGANGVWISGFFGSGKSHLLKMLALLLENRSVDGTPVLDLFLPKCGDNEFLRGELKKIASVPSKSILFNIDQKADVITKSQVDALLAVFAKVFDEMCGYYGKQGYIAQFERDLDSRGLYKRFKQVYEAVAKQPWERGREQVLLEGHNIAIAYAQVTGLPEANAAGILDKYRADYKLSIEDFAEQVNNYIEAQGPQFRLNFFVDEVGQYIADNVKLMTNLQTLAESLATKCRGRAWIVVTAQEEMNSVVGEMGKQQGNDFSKIQARFATRMKLTSQDVAEVIRKRLLLKNELGVRLLSDVYNQQQNNFKTLFDFADGSIVYRNFQDRDEFVASYPFIPYQYSLFQAAIQNLSLHNAFEGRFSSVGERSMLSVFQDVVKRIADSEMGRLATFDLMFEGIRTTLKSQIQRSILLAEKQLNNPFALKVLKALFLVKYFKPFKATQRNLMILMLEGFDRDIGVLRKRVEEALNMLEEQTYIQRNGDVYEYLTDEEKDVEEEIKHTEVDSTAVSDALAEIIFDGIIKHRKIRYGENNQDYPFARKLDDRLMGRESELVIHVISPFHEHAENEEILRAQAMGRDELLVIMPANVRLLRDLTLYKQTEKYIRQSTTVAQQESIKRIIAEKGTQNNERLVALRKLVAEELLEAKLIVAGQEIEATSADAQTRIIKGFQELIARTYPHLSMLRSVTYSEGDIENYLRPSATLLGDDASMISEAEQEVLGFIQRNKASGLRTTVHSLEQHFSRKPYGWYLAAIQCVLAKLIGRGKVEVRQDSNVLEDHALLRALRNTQGYAQLILDTQLEVSQGQMRRLRDFYNDFFDGPPVANEAKALASETSIALQEMHDELARLRREANDYPFLIALDEPLERLQEVARQPYAFYYSDFTNKQDKLLDLKEDVIAPIRAFMNGENRRIYAQARDFLYSQASNFIHAGRSEASKLEQLLADPRCYVGNQMREVKTLLDSLREQVAERVEQEQASAIQKVRERWGRLAGMSEFATLDATKQSELQQSFDALVSQVKAQPLIAVIRDTLHQFENEGYPALLRKLAAWTTPVVDVVGNGNGDDVPDEPPIEYVALRNLDVPFDKAWLADEADVDRYLAALKAAMMQEIQRQKRVQI